MKIMIKRRDIDIKVKISDEDKDIGIKVKILDEDIFSSFLVYS